MNNKAHLGYFPPRCQSADTLNQAKGLKIAGDMLFLLKLWVVMPDFWSDDSFPVKTGSRKKSLTPDLNPIHVILSG